VLRTGLGIEKSGPERSTVQSCLAAPPSVQKIRVPQITNATARWRAADAHFYVASGSLFDISAKHIDLVGFLRRQRRLLNGNLRPKTLAAARAAREKLRHHLGLIKTSLGIKNT
jgi:hypothetical protein